MSSPESVLSENEKRLLERRDEFKRADAIQKVEETTKLLGNLGLIAERLRKTDPKLVKKIGNAAVEMNELLASLGVDQLTTPQEEDIVTIQEPLHLVEEIAAPQEEVTVIQEPENQEPQEVREVASGRTAKGDEWLVSKIGEDWATQLGLHEDASYQEIAEAIVKLLFIKKPNTPETIAARIVAKLEGLEPKEIASLPNGDTASASAVNQFFNLLPQRLRGISSHSYVKVPKPSFPRPTPPAIDSVQVVEEKAEQKPSLITEAEAERVDEEPHHVKLSLRIGEYLGFTEAEQKDLELFLNPTALANMTRSKRETIVKVRENIRHLVHDPQVGLTKAESLWIIRSFGIYDMQGVVQDRDPIPMIELARQSKQNNNLPEFIYSGLKKLFATPEERELAVDHFLNSVTDPNSISDEEFKAMRSELISRVAQQTGMSDEGIKALEKRIQFGTEDEHRIASDELTHVLNEIRTQVVNSGGVNSGNPIIDKSIKQFLSHNIMASHIDAIRLELPENLQKFPSGVERVIAAGLHMVYSKVA